MTTTNVEASAIEELAGRIFSTGVGAAELCTAYLGIHLGLYKALADGPQTSAALAERTGCDERYVREWLTAQAIAGFTTAIGPDPATAEFGLAEGTYEVLVDETSPAYLGGLADIVAAAGRVLPLLADAYRSGAGVPYAAYGPDGVSAQSALNRPAFVNSLVAEWLPQLPDVLARLQDEADPARVADLACGTGWAAIELAKAFPHIQVDGLDNDEASVAIGRQHAVDHDVADRVDLEVVDLGDKSADWSPRYDLVLLIECVHDLPRPVEALRHARAAVRPGGTVLVVDERAAEVFTAPGEPTERFFAAASAIWCLPQGRVGPDPEPVGTLIRPAAMRELAWRAGYQDADVLPIEHPAWRFYRLVP
ncbi:MAG TPA: class I SAM-dependent methyltransferase [Streptosporangiaceae bacterium]|jgi:SAM-dependent methyltransferase|nr:class I SAM-dependent methyltransferase [Streptosporangiaceae bacterium]